MKSEITIVESSKETLEDVSNLCVPLKKRDEPVFVKGIQRKIEWAQSMLDTYGNCAKLAYCDSELVGMLQYIPVPHEQIIKIQCIFVPDGSYHKKGIGTRLTRALLQDVNTYQSTIDGFIPQIILAHAFDIPGQYSQHAFFEKMGFIPVKDDPEYMYYPLEKGCSYSKRQYTPQQEDKGKAIIFFDPSCPFSVFFRETLISTLEKITDIPIQVVDIFLEEEAVRKRGWVPHCIVNTVPIRSFVFDESFCVEVKKALSTHK